MGTKGKKSKMETVQLDTRTPLQRIKDERNQHLFEEYLKLMDTLPSGTTRWGLLRALGEKYSLTAQGVRTVIRKLEKGDGK